MKKINKSFILSLAGGILLLLQLLGVSVNIPLFDKFIEALCTTLIMMGIITAPKTNDSDELPPLDLNSQQDEQQANEQKEDDADSNKDNK